MASIIKIKKYRRLKRYNQIINVLVRNGFGYLIHKSGVLSVFHKGKNILNKNFDEEQGSNLISVPERIRKVIEELGPTFIKLGQILSTRPDLVPQEYLGELKKLQDDTNKVDFDDIKAVIEDELGTDIYDMFKSFDKEPIASASIAQVHKAILKDDSVVVVKVMKPKILEKIEDDLSILFDIARIVEEKFEDFYIYQPVNMVEELSEAIRKELDFTKEGRNTEKFRKHFKDSKDVYAPKIYWDYTRKKVVVMEYVDGVKINNVNAIKKLNLDNKKIAYTLAQCCMTQVFENGFFHADPHPGNIMVMNNGKLVFIDFGMVGNIDDVMMNNLLNLLVNVVNKDVKHTTNILLKIGIVKKEVHEADLRKDMRDFIDDYYDRSLDEIEVSKALNETFSIALKHGIAMPSQLTLLVKTLITIEGVVLELDPELKLIEMFEKYTKKAIRNKYKPSNILKEIKEYIEDTTDIFSSMPEQISKLLHKMNSDNIKIDIVHSGFENIIYSMNKMVNRIILALIAAAIIVGSALLAQVKSTQKIFGIPVIGFVGFAFGGIIGIWIVVSILKSDNT